MTLQAKSYEAALVKRQASDARKRSQPRTPSKMKRTKMVVVRRVSKKATSDGDSEKAVKDECDNIIRDIIELRDRRCFTCHVPRAHYKNIFPGHFITRKVLALRWSTANVHAQCNVCNGEHNISPGLYRRRLVDHYDDETVCELERIGRENPRIEYVDLLAIRDGLRAELERMKK